MRYSHLLLAATLAFGGAALPVSAFAHDTDKAGAEKSEKHIQLKDLPAPAADAVRREAEGGKVVQIDKMQRNGETVYEAHIKKGTNESGVIVDAKGNVVERRPGKS